MNTIIVITVGGWARGVQMHVHNMYFIADSAEDVQVGCNSEFHAARQSSDN